MTTHGDPRAVVQSVQRAIASSPGVPQTRRSHERRSSAKRFNASAPTSALNPSTCAAAALAELDEAEPGSPRMARVAQPGGSARSPVRRSTRSTFRRSSPASSRARSKRSSTPPSSRSRRTPRCCKRSPRPSTSTCRTTSPTTRPRTTWRPLPIVFDEDTTSGTPVLEVNRTDPAANLPSFFTDLGFDNPAQIDPVSVDEVIVPAARKTIAEQRHQTLATMVLMGLNRIVVDDGEINAKLAFHIDASETTAITFDPTQTNIGTLAGVVGHLDSSRGTGDHGQHHERQRAERHQRSGRSDRRGPGSLQVRLLPTRASSPTRTRSSSSTSTRQCLDDRDPGRFAGADGAAAGADATRQPAVQRAGARRHQPQRGAAARLRRSVESAPMSWPELSDTLTALVSAFEPPADSGLTLKRAELVVPLEAATGDAPDGPLVLARAPHSRWVSGFLPPIQSQPARRLEPSTSPREGAAMMSDRHQLPGRGLPRGDHGPARSHAGRAATQGGQPAADVRDPRLLARPTGVRRARRGWPRSVPQLRAQRFRRRARCRSGSRRSRGR